jgi:hypothetical protein
MFNTLLLLLAVLLDKNGSTAFGYHRQYRQRLQQQQLARQQLTCLMTTRSTSSVYTKTVQACPSLSEPARAV